MQIELVDTENEQSTILCDGATRELTKATGPDAFHVPLQFIVQQSHRLRANSAKSIPRKNAASTIRFGVRRRFSSQVAAMDWLLAHLAGCARGGTLYFRGDGGIWSIPYVGLQSIDHQPPTDATLRLQYTLTGGRPTNS